MFYKEWALLCMTYIVKKSEERDSVVYVLNNTLLFSVKAEEDTVSTLESFRMIVQCLMILFRFFLEIGDCQKLPCCNAAILAFERYCKSFPF